ncbi:vitamin B12-dependent ribonucleotide reductase [Tunturiibacter gelidoferens]|uniref:Vitamin B12-dependent ribonucleotide reductase n=1 Tax=Tunturiibacter gelidiferens TaxID=3069689 RepID=A0A9X0U4L3_9BACT|nr:vitamin B12-dependent ribonucleotide reductase [Edaphobacter lichenicola]MBB5329095.1 ribonucleoside-diphosphate reductase alpha chain [Edaphobacter lichenicola]
MATIPNQTQTQTVAQTASGAAGFKNQRTPGLTFDRHFTKPGISPYDEIVWELRDAIIQDFKGKTIFEQKNVEVPADWSMTATNIVASKYLHGLNGTDERESGVRALITRVAESIRDWGIADGYFASQADADTFYAELAHLLLNQKVAFNSPVWFNVGCDRLEPNSDAQNWHWNATTGKVEFSVTGYTKPQCSACFINSVQDSLDSILTLAKTEGMLFKWGSGAGSNLSNIRGSMETLSGGGTASGPLSFMRGFDAFAGVIKSGGKTRRAAKMVILNADHPDIEDFVQCKVKEEQKAWHLMQAGYDGSGPDSEAYSSIFFQNANNSVRVTDEFMRAVESDGTFVTRTVKERTPVKEYKARDLMHNIAEATWQCGDPGMQYDTTINRWHTSKNTARINASNPCSEYMFLDDSACNLASFNLLKFLTPGGQFDIPSYRHAIAIVTTAMEIIVDSAGYPTEMISKNSHDYRPLGLGYANLGALLMAFGLPYDSDAGRDFAATLTSILCGDAYWQSSRIAETCPPLGAATPLTQQAGIAGGACPGFYVNREPFLDVIRMHRAEVNNIGRSKNSAEPFFVPQLDQLIEASRHAWDGALAHGEKHGYRNSQVTVLAPTGTIGFMMDCDTTGIEPDLALVKYKKLVGGGMIKIVNNTVPSALIKLGYDEAQVNAIVSYIDATGTIEGAPAIKPEHLAVFDCSFKPSKGTRSISYMGHIKMMGATQPFLSGAISKTVNLPQDCSVDDIAEAYMESWRQGLKAVAIYRDNSKGTQPLNVTAQTDADKKGTRATNAVASTTEKAASDKNGVILSEGAAEVEGPAVAAVKLQLTEAMETATAAHIRIHNLETQLKQITEAALQNSDAADSQAPPRAVRHRLPAERASVTHKFGLAGHEGYITVGLYPNGQPGEIFIRMAKEGSTVSGLMDSFATAVSLALQHGVPLRVLCEKFAHTRFEPSGWTGNEQIGYAKSIMDYIFRWIQIRFLSGHQFDLFAGLSPQAQSQPQAQIAIPVQGTVTSPANRVELNASAPAAEPSSPSPLLSSRSEAEGSAFSTYDSHEHTHPTTPPQEGIAPDLSARSGLESPMSLEDRGIYHASDAMKSMYEMGDSPSCATCGAIMTRSGSCYRCMSCGSTSGCS